MQPESREHGASGAGILAGHDINGSQNGAGAIREIAQIADGGSHHIEVAGQGRERSVGGRRGHDVADKWREVGRALLAHPRNTAFPVGGPAPRN